MAVALTSGVPLMNTDGQTSTDTDRVFRKMVAGLLLADPKSANPLGVRNGVLPHNWDAQNSCTTFRPGPTTPTAGMSVDIQAGMAVVERAGQGPYFVIGENVFTVPLAPSNTQNPRIDLIYAWIGDQSIMGNSDPLHGPVLDVVTGTPGQQPTVPTAQLPDGAVVLAQVYVAANAASITSAAGVILDKRRSTGLTGGARHLLPGDSVTDPGRIDGETRFRTAVAPYPAFTDYWDAAQQRWRGTQEFAFTQPLPGVANSASLVGGNCTTPRTTLVTVHIPDPGVAYRLTATALLKVTPDAGTANVYCAANNGPIVSHILNTGDGNRCNLGPTDKTIFTGDSDVRLNIDLISGAKSAAWGGDVRNLVTVTMVPA